VSGENIKTEKIFNWGDIKRDIQNETPDLRDFAGGDPYSDEEVARDLATVRQIKSKPEYRKGDMTDSEVQEYATAQEIGEMDWFGEELRRDELFPDGMGSDTCTFMTSEFDDHVNHIDAVCLMNNVYSDFRPVPFALDLTYSDDPEVLDRKFNWLHKSKYVASPGFTKVKYFEDTFNAVPLLPKGWIGVLPRFIVGFSSDLSQKITEERMTNTGWGALSREEPSSEAKFCVLKELKTQSEQMLEWLDKHRNDSRELKRMYRNVTALDKFFGGALKTAREHDPRGFEAYSNRDSVVQQIMGRNIVRGT